jgi:hypothetical protein
MSWRWYAWVMDCALCVFFEWIDPWVEEEVSYISTTGEQRGTKRISEGNQEDSDLP